MADEHEDEDEDEDSKKKKKLPANISGLKKALMAAASSIGPARAGKLWLRLDDRNGAMTVGAAADPFPTSCRYAINMRTVAHGYITFGEPGGAREVMVAMVDQPVKPVPPGGYVQKFGEPGAKDCLRIVLTNLDEPGHVVTFDALGKSSANRLRQLYWDTLANLDTEIGERGYVHPVIKARAGSYFNREQSREIFHFDYVIVDWLRDGEGDPEGADNGGSNGPILWSAAKQDEPTEEAPWAVEPPRQAARKRRAKA